MELRDHLQSTLGTAYTLERELPSGGMARVFKAEETRLGRKVVVKVLNPELAAGLSAERFEREIRVAANLQDPRIVAVLSAGEADGVPYYTMPYVDGENLRVRLARGSIPLPEAVSILRDIALALECAHARGVVHRDIKPENVLLAGHTAMVTDFGIAKALTASHMSGSASVDATLTQLGMALGTPAYLAPEQAVGDEVDHRADIYAWGVVAYEVLAGAHPFAGRPVQALIAAHVLETVPPLGNRRPRLPARLVDLVHQCLAKDPALRPPYMPDVLGALDDAIREIAAGERSEVAADVNTTLTGGWRPSIAVLPFASLSPDQGDRYLADGLTDELITDLSAVRSVRVIARGSAMRFRDAAHDPVAAARELGVGFILEGSVKRTPDSLRITTRLVDATDGSAVWSDKMSGALDDLFAMQERLSRSIVGALAVVPAPDEERRMAARPIADVRAYESYLRARHEMWSFTASGYVRAQELLQNALAIVGENPLLYASLGQLHTLRMEGSPSAEAAALVQEAERCARRVSDLEPDSAHAHRLWGFIHWKRRAIHEAVRSFERARELDPSNPDVLLQLAHMYVLMGRDAEARQAAADAIAVDPLTPVVHCMPGFCDFVSGQAERALPAYRKFLAMDPGNPAAHWFLVWVLGHTGHADEVPMLARDLIQRFPRTLVASIASCYSLALAGDAAGARAAITPELEAAGQSTEFFARGLADCWALMGDVDRAVDSVADAVRMGLWNYPYLARHDRHLEPLRADPRFRALLERVRRAWETGEPPPPPPPAREVPVVAVLPFASLSPDPDNTFFADGLTEEIIVDLSRIKSLRITSRNSAMRYKGTAKETKTIGRELGARYLLEGTVRRAGSSLRVTTQLVEAESDTQLWSERFNGSLEDVFEIQEQIARRIAGALALRLTPEEEQRLETRAIADVRAFELYLRARQLNLQFTEPALETAMQLVDRASAIEGESPVLLGLKAALLQNLFNIGARGPEALAEATVTADRALAADPNLAQALVARALLESNRPRVDSALVLRLLRWACDVEPNPDAAMWLAVFLSETGRPELAVPFGRRARQLDPVTPVAAAAEAFPFVFAGRAASGLSLSRSAVERDPHDSVTRFFHGVFCAVSGELGEAKAHLDVVKDSAWGMLAELYRRAWAGDVQGLHRQLAEPYLVLHTDIDEQNAWFAAQALTIAGEHDEAMRRLRHAAERGFVNARFVSEIDQLLAPLRTHQDFPALVAFMERRATEIARESGF